VSTVARILLAGGLLGLAGCKSLPFDRNPSERPSQVALSLYVTEQANPNPDAPVESEPSLPPIRIELSGNNLNDVAAQLAAMAKLIDQERQSPGSVHPVPPVATDKIAVELGAPACAASLGGEDVTDATPAIHVTEPVSSKDPVTALPDLPLGAVFEHQLSSVDLDEDADADTRGLGTYRGEATSQAAPGTVAVRRGTPSPLAIQVVQLRDDSMLLNADYDVLAVDLKKALGATYLRHDDYVLKPGQYKTVPLRKLDPEALYIGVIAAYHELDLHRWKAVYRLEAIGHRYALLMAFDEDGASIRAEQLR
jgi:type VI secretion system protein VasD